MLWVTRTGGNVDRVAYPWLIKRFNHGDTSSRTSAYKMAEGEGLEAIARAFAILTADDHRKLEYEFPMHDALYALCQRKTTG